MQLRDFYNDKETIQARIPILQALIILGFLVLLAGLWKVQILRHNYYSARAEQNQFRSIRWVAPRGKILDRYGRPLANNRRSYTLSVTRRDLSELESSLDLLTKGLQFRARLPGVPNREAARPAPDTCPLVLKEDAGIGDISFIEAHRRSFRPFRWFPIPSENYPEDEVAAHLLGYVTEISENQLESGIFGDTAKPGDIVGQKGVERVYDHILRGVDGEKTVRVDSRGREIESTRMIPPQAGDNLRLTIDIDIQRAAEKAFGDKAGAAVAVDPRTGEVLCLLSRPAFDPNSFATRISRQKWDQLLLDPQKPMQNRAIQSRFPPGSVFKIFLAVAGLQEGILTPTHTEHCSGGTQIYGRHFACWKEGGHGRVDLHRAIVSSCNVFFYRLGRKLGIDRIAVHAKAMGLGYKTGIDLLGEDPGNHASSEWKRRIYNANWYPGETIFGGHRPGGRFL